MRTFLPSIVLGVAALGAVSSIYRPADPGKALDALPGSKDVKLAEGLDAMTGAQLYRLFPELLGVAGSAPTPLRLNEGHAQPIPEHGPGIETLPSATRAAVRPAVVEAWADAHGLVHCRLADGSEFIRLESGELVAVQPLQNETLASIFPEQ